MYVLIVKICLTRKRFNCQQGVKINILSMFILLLTNCSVVIIGCIEEIYEKENTFYEYYISIREYFL